MMKFKTLFGDTKPVIAMVHLNPMPGTPLYDADAGVEGIVEAARRELSVLQEADVDAVMFGNENDRPYVFKASPATLAAMTAVIQALKPVLKVPFGVNYLWDPSASVAIACATGASFAREIFTGLFASDMGLWQPSAAEALRLRRDLGRPDLKLLFNINAEFAASLDHRPIALRAKSAVFSSLADAILVSGPITGQPAETSDLKAVADAVKTVPIFANTGVRLENVREVLSLADGVIVGTHFKVDGDTWNAVDAERVKRFMDVVEEFA